MLRKGIGAIVCLAVMMAVGSWAAVNWQLQTRLNTAGGTIKVGGKAAQTTVGVTVFNNMTTTAVVPVVVHPNTGYKISALTKSGVAQALPAAGSDATINFSSAGGNQNLIASFQALPITVSASAGAGGTITPASATVPYNGSIVFTVAPSLSSTQVASITRTAGTGTLTLKNTSGAVVTLPYAGTVKATLSGVISNATVNATFNAMTANAGADQTVAVNTQATLYGVASGSSSYLWTQTAGPAVTLSSDTALQPTFTPTAAGTYTFKLTVGGAANDTVNVLVVDSLNASMQAQCDVCHVADRPNILTAFSKWSTSAHVAGNVSCLTCHGMNMPNEVRASTVNGSNFTVTVNNARTGAVGSSYCAKCHTAPKTSHNVAAVTCTGCHVNGVHNPDTTEADALTKCANCHGATVTAFNGGIHKTNPYHQLACADCHGSTAHGLTVPTAAASCIDCHGPYAAEVIANYTKSSHNTGHGSYYGMQTSAKGCYTCHNAHTTVATATDGKTDSCGVCHHTRNEGLPTYVNYGIYTTVAGGGGLKTPHGGGLPSTGGYVDGTQRTQYLSQGALCTDCHGHDNTINVGYAEGGHGHVSSVAMNAFTHYDWSARVLPTAVAYGTRGAGNCNRCHTTSGFVRLLGDTATASRIEPVTGIQNVLTCIGCHTSVEGGLRTEATPAGTTTKLKDGYFALFSSTKATIGNPTKIQVEFPGFKNSGVCIPCHSGRTTDTYVAAKIATVANYSTLQGSDYQHAANMGQTFIGKGAMTFSTGTAATSVGISAHASVQMGSGQEQGPCVGCHYSTEGKTHSLEVEAGSTTCTACHDGAPNVAAAKANYDAGVKALDALIRAKMAPLLASGDSNLAAERAGYWRFGRLNNTGAATRTTATNGYATWYNWQLLSLWDSAAYAHNPAYARVILNETLEFLYNGYTAKTDPSYKSASYIIANINTIVPTAGLTGTEVTDAGQFVNNSEAGTGCIGCHDIDQAGTVDANTGVRGVMGEFTKRSHHITGSTPTNAQCAVCHMEGTAGGGVNAAYHKQGGKVHLRNCNKTLYPTTNSTDSNEFVWDPATPDHTAMDQFCFSCHNAAGAPNAVGIVSGNSASNPFGDTLTNSYDLVARAGVVDVYSAFNTANASHHAVLGAKYQFRFSNAANAAAWATRNGKTAPDASQLADGKTVGGTTVDFSGHYDPAGAHEGGEATLYEADKFVATYIPLGATENVGDNSTLHCGDCHTVGQWNAGTSTNADGSTTSIIIGAHGSANDYMLRNSLGSDALHSGQTYVCFNCHKGGQLEPYAEEGQVAILDDTLWADLIAEGQISSTRVKPTWNVGWGKTHPNVIAGQVSGYANAHAVSAFHAQCQADSSNQTGHSLTVKSRSYYNLNGHKDRTLDYSPALNATAALPTAAGEGGNITGIACTNCHNSGLRQGWGGIHGGDNTYTDGLGRSQKSYRFMPGMGNYRYAPPGGWDGKSETDSRYIIQQYNGGADPTLPANKMAGKGMGGCYTNNSVTQNLDANGVGWSSCAHHGTSTVAPYYGGTTRTENTSSSPTWEPTVREATAGNSLVTRPLKY